MGLPPVSRKRNQVAVVSCCSWKDSRNHNQEGGERNFALTWVCSNLRILSRAYGKSQECVNPCILFHIADKSQKTFLSQFCYGFYSFPIYS